MLIVSQDRNRIVNLNNVDSIDIDTETPYMNIINYETSTIREELGIYETEIRAEEVLQELIGQYCRNANNCIYQMPEK